MTFSGAFEARSFLAACLGREAVHHQIVGARRLRLADAVGGLGALRHGERAHGAKLVLALGGPEAAGLAPSLGTKDAVHQGAEARVRGEAAQPKVISRRQGGELELCVGVALFRRRAIELGGAMGIERLRRGRPRTCRPG